MPRCKRFLRAIILVALLGAVIPSAAQDRQNPDVLPEPAMAGAEYRYVFRLAADEHNASGALRWTLKAGELPPGLILETSGTLTGTVATRASGRFVFELQVKDAAGATGSMWFALDVKPPLRIARAANPLRIAAASGSGMASPVGNGNGSISAAGTTSPSHAAGAAPLTTAAPAAQAPAPATEPTPPFVNKVKEGAKTVTGKVPKGKDRALAQIFQGDKFVHGAQAAAGADGSFSVELQFVATMGQKVRVIPFSGETQDTASEFVQVEKGPAEVLLTDPVDGSTEVAGMVSPGVTRVLVEVKDDDGVVQRLTQPVQGGGFQKEVNLTEGQIVEVFDYSGNTKGTASAKATVREKPCDPDLLDCRDTFGAFAHLGVAIDTFGSDSTLQYLNPAAAKKTKERFTAGFNFEYRVAGTAKTKPTDDKKNIVRAPQLWVYGETVHGVRSTEFPCPQGAAGAFCSDLGPTVPTNPAQSIFGILRAASSLEAFVGLRQELFAVQAQHVPPASFYLKGQAGFLRVSGTPDDVVDIHHVGLGLVTTKGKFQDSYLEAGFGRTDLFQRKRKDRWKLDAQLNIDLGLGVSFYTQLNVDADAGFGSDSVQHYYGFAFDLKKVSRCWFRPGC